MAVVVAVEVTEDVAVVTRVIATEGLEVIVVIVAVTGLGVILGIVEIVEGKEAIQEEDQGPRAEADPDKLRKESFLCLSDLNRCVSIICVCDSCLIDAIGIINQ